MKFLALLFLSFFMLGQAKAQSFKFEKSNYQFSLSWVSGPIKGQNKFVLKSWNIEEGTINGPYQDLPAKLHIYLWMPDMGHGSAPVKIKKVAEGEYDVANVYLMMGGTWEIYFQLLENEAVLDEVVIPLTL
jgi:hypothetical protein